METNQLLLEIKNLLASNQTDYCDTEEASRILALPSRHLKALHEKFGLPRYPRVKSFVYKKMSMTFSFHYGFSGSGSSGPSSGCSSGPSSGRSSGSFSSFGI